MNYTYETKTDKNKNVLRYKCWIEQFKDEDTGTLFPVKRRELIKVNGQKVVWYRLSQLAYMNKKEQKSIRPNWKKKRKSTNTNHN